MKSHKPGIRIPTAKGSIRHKSKKDYKRIKSIGYSTCNCGFMDNQLKLLCPDCGEILDWQSFKPKNFTE